jgi:hypothetical protein
VAGFPITTSPICATGDLLAAVTIDHSLIGTRSYRIHLFCAACGRLYDIGVSLDCSLRGLDGLSSRRHGILRRTFHRVQLDRRAGQF